MDDRSGSSQCFKAIHDQVRPEARTDDLFGALGVRDADEETRPNWSTKLLDMAQVREYTERVRERLGSRAPTARTTKSVGGSRWHSRV